MSRPRALLAALLVLCSIAGVAAAQAVVGQPMLDATLGSGSVHPGEETTLSVTILNNGSVERGSLQNPALTQRVTTARGLRVTVNEPDRTPLSVRAGTFAVGSLPEGGAAPLEVPVSVDEDAEPGRYSLPITVSYRHTSEIESSGEEVTENVTRTLAVDLRVEPTPRFRVVDAETDLRVASTDTVTLTVENVGSATAHDATVVLESGNPALGFGGAASATRFVGEWPAGETRTVAFEMVASDSATAQDYPLTVRTDYEDDDGVARQSERRQVSIRPRPEGAFAVGNVTSTLSVGAEGDLSGTITNVGADAAQNVVVVFTDQRATMTPLETEAAVGDLGPGETARFSFPIEVSGEATPGPRQFAVMARYRAGGDVRESDTYDVRADVGPETPAFGVETGDARVEPGGTATINVTVTNAGEVAYSDVSAKLFADSPIGVSDDEAFVQSLEPGESTQLTFAISADASALAKDYPVSLDFRYDDADGDTKTSDTYRRAVTVTEPDESGGLPWIPIAVVVLVLVAVGLYYRSRR